MIKIAKDVPKELKALALKLKLNNKTEADIYNMVANQLKPLALKYLKVRADKIEIESIEADERLQPLANFISKLDFKGLGAIKRKLALGFIESYLKKEKYL